MSLSLGKSPAYLVKQKHVFYFRVRVPADIRPRLGLTEFRYSLGTSYLHEARPRAMCLGAMAKDLFSRIRKDCLGRAGMSVKQVQGLAESCFRKTLKTWGVASGYEHPLSSATSIPSPSPTPAPISAPESEPDSQKSERLSEVSRVYISENEQAKKWTVKTQEEITAILRLFVDVAGDRPVTDLNHRVMREYKDALRRLPANRAKDKRYRDKTVAQLLEMEDVEPMSIRTINKNLEKTASFLKWTVKQGYIPVNYGEGLSLPVSTRAQEERSPFDAEDLRKLFHSPGYLKGSFKHSYQFWVPLIGLFSGCRIEEICQLHLKDIRQEDGVWVFDINSNGDKKLKTMNSKRLVPIHPFLVEDLGLIRHVEKLKAQGEKRLFPELPKRRDGYSQDASRWFGRYKKVCGIEDPKKVFHSFRHTFDDHLKQKRVDYVMLAELMGHEVQGETMGRYGKRYSPTTLLKEAVSRLDFNLFQLIERSQHLSL